MWMVLPLLGYTDGVPSKKQLPLAWPYVYVCLRHPPQTKSCMQRTILPASNRYPDYLFGRGCSTNSSYVTLERAHYRFYIVPSNRALFTIEGFLMSTTRSKQNKSTTPRTTLFRCKKELPWVEFEPTTLCSLGRALLPGKLSWYIGVQHNTRQRQTSNHCAVAQYTLTRHACICTAV